MHRRRLLLVIVLVVIIAVAAVVAYTSPSWLPRSTTLTVSPSNYVTFSGTELALTASVKYGSAAVGGGTITWQTTGGTLSKNTGTSVVFTAPSVTGNESFTITASFGGTGVYQPSSATAHVTVSPPRPKETVLTVAPSMFELHGGGTQVLNATLVPSGAPADQIAWTITPSGLGSLSSTTGSMVSYTAPNVQQATPVTITASFAGNTQYNPSSANSNGSVLPTQMAMRNSTTLVVSPSSFSLGSSGSQALTAIVQSNGQTLSDKAITWTLTPSSVGSLSSTTGPTVTYTAPTVQQNTTVTITASFAGDSTYLGSSGTSRGVVTPPSMLQYLYTLQFSSGVMTKVSVQGPIVLNGTSVTLITAESANLSSFSLTRFGLTASTMYVDDLELYTTYVSSYSSAFGGALTIKGDQTINLGPKDTALFGNTTMQVIRMDGDSANLTSMVSVGQFVGGSEPYIPSIITAPSVSMSNTYSITGPTTWESEVNMVSNITTGRIDLPQFAIQHPISYSLDRHTKEYNATEVWSLTASSATALKVSAFVIYFKVTGGEMVTLVVTGSDNPANMIPFDLNTGGGFNGLYADVHPVYFAAQQLRLGSFVISITPPSAPVSSMSPLHRSCILGCVERSRPKNNCGRPARQSP